MSVFQLFTLHFSVSVSSISLVNCLYLYTLFLLFLGPHLQHMEDPKLGVKSELLLPAYTTATATQDLSRVCDLHHSSRQCQILNPLSKARDGALMLMDTSQVCYAEAQWELLYFGILAYRVHLLSKIHVNIFYYNMGPQTFNS